MASAASFGEQWAATLTKAVAAAGADLPLARKAIEAARHIEMESPSRDLMRSHGGAVS